MDKPSINELGVDLLKLSRFQLTMTIATPFIFFILYFVFAGFHVWTGAVICTMGLSFFTYGSTSHDLVHENLRLNKKVNTLLLTTLELISFRSGHAYKLSHLHHHKRYPHDDDVEGAAAKMSFIRALMEGFIFQPKLYFWALTKHRHHKYYRFVICEGVAIVVMMFACIYSVLYTPVFLIYMVLMIAGSWIIPFVTSYVVHTPHGEHELKQTRLFRGKFFATIAFNHLFHLEHHLYPMVPHKNWPKLANRLDNFFERKNIRPIQVKL